MLPHCCLLPTGHFVSLAQQFADTQLYAGWIERGAVNETSKMFCGRTRHKGGGQGRAILTTLSRSVDWFVCLYEYHSIPVAQENLRFFVELEMTII